MRGSWLGLFVRRGLIYCLCHALIHRYTSAYCLYGDAPDCAFQCHCAVASECGAETSTCPSGCAYPQFGPRWSGPGCQIGNVGLHKTADMTGRWSAYPASAALDGLNPGRLSRGQCAHPTGSNPANWWADLGGPHKVTNVIIYGRTDCCGRRMQDFDLTVYNVTGDDEVLCAYQENTISSAGEDIQCQTPIVGRYVRFKRRGGYQPSEAGLCEVVILGHRYIDCSLCPSGVNCNDVTGCETCTATYQPNCATPCEPGFYGNNCADRCDMCRSGTTCNIYSGVCPGGCQPRYFGTKCTEECQGHCKTGTGCHSDGQCMDGCDPGYYGSRCTQQCGTACRGGICGDNGDCTDGCTDGYYGPRCASECSQNCKGGSVCDDENGECPGGCELWYADEKCSIFIDTPNYSDETTEPPEQSGSSVLVRWQHLRDISPELRSFYFYSIQQKIREPIANYMANIDLSGYTEAGIVPYTGEPFWNVTGLDPNTNYVILIIPFREYNGTRDYGRPYPDVYVKTNCDNPEKPQILRVIKLESANELPNISVIFEKGETIRPNCLSISSVSLHYKPPSTEQFKSHNLDTSDTNFTIVPSESGKYDIKIEVENNEGYTSSSDIYTIDISGGSTKPDNQVAIIAGSVAVVLVILVVVIVLVLMLRRRRRARKPEYDPTKHENMGFGMDREHETGEVIIAGAPVNNHTTETVEPDVVTPAPLKSPPIAKKPTSNMDPVKHKPKQSEEKDVQFKESRGHVDVPASVDIPTPQGESLYANSDVALVNFEGYVARRKANLEDLFAEYRSLPQPDLDRCNAGRTEHNKMKNRFKNIFPYDETRVHLDGDEDTEYINANYIIGYNKKREYIATQGTKKDTVEDFWRMMWKEAANRIIMVANVEEKGKRRVDPYWPERIGETLTVGDFNITTESLEATADCTTRIMSLRRKNETRTVHQFHFTTWEDKNKPVYGPMSLLSFCNKVHSFDRFSKGPMVVHCSAGVGRTGTFIALDILKHMASRDKSLDIYSCVKRLRNERMHMVQTKEQYVFLHDVLVEFVKYGNKAYDCQEFTKTFATICDEHPDKALMIQLQDELKLVSELIKTQNGSRNDGLNPRNVDKNRNDKIIPDDRDRLHISGKQNYINAVFVDSFKAHDAYIVTQMPLPDTVADFWQLVLEQGSQTIVMLNQLDSSDQLSDPYWPEHEQQPQTYGKIQVELVSVNSSGIKDAITIRDFNVRKIEHKSVADPFVLRVRHFQLLSWPQSDDLPRDRGHILDLIDLIQSWQQHHNVPADKCKSLVHCLDGGSHSGMFCAASFTLDRMKVEQEVDAFLAVRSVSRRRPEFFTKLVEYQFLYQMALESMTKYNQYANFQ